MFILSCSAALAFGLFPFAAGQSVASGDRGKMETAPRPGLECLQVTLLIRQMVLDRYDSTGTGILSEQDKARLVEDARSARREARKAFLRKFDKDGDGRLSPEEYRAFREHVEKRRGVRRPDAGPDKRDGIPFYSPAERKEIPPPPPPAEGDCITNCNTTGVEKITNIERKKKKLAINLLPRSNNPSVKSIIKTKKIPSNTAISYIEK